MKTEYTIQYFIEKFEAIPEERWTTGTFKDDLGRCCVLGHCGHNIYRDTEESRYLYNILSGSNYGAISINDGLHRKYSQHTPKQRVLAALHDKLGIEHEPTN